MKYVIEKREVHTVRVEIEAPDPKTALTLVVNGDGQEVDGSSQYSETVDPSGVGGSNLYQWRIFGHKMDEHIGTPAAWFVEDGH